MITVNHDGKINFYEGLSTDQKPSGTYLNGSIFYEMDTGNVFIYDEANEIWRKQ